MILWDTPHLCLALVAFLPFLAYPVPLFITLHGCLACYVWCADTPCHDNTSLTLPCPSAGLIIQSDDIPPHSCAADHRQGFDDHLVRDIDPVCPFDIFGRMNQWGDSRKGHRQAVTKP